MKKICSLLFTILLISIIFSNTGASDKIHNNKSQENLSDKEIIDEYTWSVIKYSDWLPNTVNSEIIYISNPTYGPLLVLTDFMSPDLCKVALEVYSENEDGSLNETNTLNKLVNYVNESVVHYSVIDVDVIFNNSRDLWDSPAVENTGKKISAQEMAALGNRYCDGKYDFIGDCYSVSSFITAVLRLCGFSTKDVFNVNIGGEILPIAFVNKIPIIMKPYGVGHVVNFVNSDGKWYVIDGTMWRNASRGRLFTEKDKYQIGKIAIVKNDDLYNMTVLNRFFIKDRFSFFENDKYFLGHTWQADPRIYSNINKEEFRNIFNSAFTKGFNNARFSFNPYIFKRLFVWRISNRATEHPYVNTIGLPYTVNDAIGETREEKAQHLAQINREFVNNHKMVNGLLNQYDKAFYAYGYINVTYPQAYANAARLAAHTSWFGYTNDTNTPIDDVNNTISWIRNNFVIKRILNDDQIAFSDLTYNLKNGSTLDQAVFAYGVIRNMKKEDNFWSPDNLFVIVTKDNEGYLAVNITGDEWVYLNFGEGKLIRSNIENISFAFNEEIKLESWQQ